MYCCRCGEKEIDRIYMIDTIKNRKRLAV